MATGIRVLPWKRHVERVSTEVDRLIAIYREARPHADLARVVEAYEFAEAAHDGQLRVSGEPYITHPVAVASIVARYGPDEDTVCAALLHDVVEDCDVSLSEVEAKFGPGVALLVDGCTKLARSKLGSKEAQKAETMRKIILAMARDIRVIVIKLADRVHNLRTVAGMSSAHQIRTARETLDIYAPLAHRLGMGELRQQMEDLCFAALEPAMYAEIDKMVADRAPMRSLYLSQVIEAAREQLTTQRVNGEVFGRPKHLWSIYEKMAVRHRPFEEIHDLVGLRVVVPETKDCYAALGALHALWSPVPGRLKDYIAQRKINHYQSIHTTVVGPQNRLIEIQIRTQEMHRAAEFGAAAHYDYKASGRGEGQERGEWLSRIIEWQKEVSDPNEFLSSLKVDLGLDEIYVFTPKSDLITLPAASTPIDFAYAIHTEVGHRCIGARVNGQLVPLDHELESGDTVEIFTSKVGEGGPRPEWLDMVKSRSAVHKIRHWFSREAREDAVESGRDTVERALRRDGLPSTSLVDSDVLALVAEDFGFATPDELYRAVAGGRADVGLVVEATRKRSAAARAGQRQMMTDTAFLGTADRPGDAAGFRVRAAGWPGEFIEFATCCNPVPPDEIVGYRRPAEGILVHQAECVVAAATAATDPTNRSIDVDWIDPADDLSGVEIEVRGLDRRRLLSDVCAAVGHYDVNILGCHATIGDHQVFTISLTLQVIDPAHLDAVLASVGQIESIFDAHRVIQS